MHALEIPARFVRGNADRALRELVTARRRSRPRASWMLAQHREEDLAFLAGFEQTVSVDVDGIGPTCFCHGSPRSDEECVTPQTPVERVREFMAGRDEQVVVTAHVHVQYDRTHRRSPLRRPGKRRGLPYDMGGSAYWALLGRTSSCVAPSTTSRTPSR